MKAGTQVMIGAPAQPMEAERLEALRSLLNGEEAIAEAHLPQMFAPGAMNAPGKVLVVILKPDAVVETVMERLDEGLKKILGDNEYLDVLPVSHNNPLLEDFRNVQCRLK